MPPGARASACLRRRKSAVSRLAVPRAAAKKHCRMVGSVACARGPVIVGSVGTTRQPRHCRPFCPARAAIASCAAVSSPAGKKTMPRPNSSGRQTPASSAAARMNRSGIAISRPAPSPLRPSASTPPRCARRSSAVSARPTISCDGAAPSRVTKPTPQASWSGA